MEKFILISQAVSLSVVFYVVIYFLITWQWPASLLSLFVCTVLLYFLVSERDRVHRVATVDFVSATVPDSVAASLKWLGGR